MTRLTAPLAATVAVLLAGTGVVDAFWRLPCQGRTGVARIDPLAQYGEVAHHAHVIHGGNNFGFDSDYEDLMASDCTSCAVKQDKSVYWTPGLYFESTDGEMTLVKQVGGMLVYYLLFGQDIQAFPPHFKMIAGDADRREFTLPVPDPPKSEWSGDQVTESALRQKALGFNCLDYSKQPEPTLFRHFLPDKAYIDANCPDGVRFELMFPSCWNGDVDSDDHMSHVAYPNQVLTGECPEDFPKRLISLLFETIWDTNAFKGQEGRFVLSNGDPTGYGYHGDFINAWEESFLQSAIGTCTNPSGKVEDCPLFELQSEADQQQCTFTPPDIIADEDCKGPRQGLPGNVNINEKGGEEKKAEDYGYDKKKEEKAADEESPSTSSTPAPSPTEVPTLSYTSATTESDTEAALVDVQTPTSTSSSTSSTPETLVAEEEQVVAAEAEITAAAVDEESSEAAAPSFASTTTYVTNGTLMKVYVVHETVSVTADVTESVTASTTGAYARKNKRALHNHQHKHLHAARHHH